MDVKSLLEFYGLDTTQSIKMIRHKDDGRGHDIHYLEQIGHFETYQSYQKKRDFNCDYIVSFVGLDGQLARFVGVYKVNEVIRESQHPLPEDFYYYDSYKPTRNWYYELEKQNEFLELEKRLIIKWTGNMRAWNQWIDTTPKEVFEILPKGRFAHFPGYLDFSLTHNDLQEITRYPEVNKEWRETLSKVSGIYMVLDVTNGKQYVGSAYGKEGVWKRFLDYAKTGHGGNKELKEILAADPLHIHNFRFTLLETLPLSMTPVEVIKREDLYKKKLGSRKHGMNNN